MKTEIGVEYIEKILGKKLSLKDLRVFLFLYSAEKRFSEETGIGFGRVHSYQLLREETGLLDQSNLKRSLRRLESSGVIKMESRGNCVAIVINEKF